MKNNKSKLTISQFAKLHKVNKRTLHYYDEIGIFSPMYKNENGYRYYDYMQGSDFEYIKMLKELNMGLDEIKKYKENPNEEDFKKIAERKLLEIDEQIKVLNSRKYILKDRIEKLNKCEQIRNNEINNEEIINNGEVVDEKKNINDNKSKFGEFIEIVQCDEEKYFFVPFKFEDNDVEKLIAHVNDIWSIEECCRGIGSCISIEKVKGKYFKEYDGLFINITEDTDLCKISDENILLKPKGKYLSAYHRGDWDGLPNFYAKILDYADENNLNLVGYSFEIGMNDFAISNDDDYITQIMIKVE